MNRFIKNFLLFSVVLVLLSTLLDKVVSSGLKNSNTKLFSNLKKVSQGSINADIIINGSSKALVQIDPFIIDSILELNTYNLGLDGSPFIPQLAQYELYKLRNKKPKAIIQVVSNATLRSMSSGFKDHVKFAPYLDIPRIKELMKLTGSFSTLDYALPMVRYLGKPFEIIIGLASFCNIQLLAEEERKGYYPKDKYWLEGGSKNKSIKELALDAKNIKEYTVLDSTSSNNLNEFLNQCNKEGIIVFLVYPPLNDKGFHTVKHISYYKKIAASNNAIFLNYSKDSTISYNKNLFYNTQHLNKTGATIFTTKLSQDINSYLK